MPYKPKVRGPYMPTGANWEAARGNPALEELLIKMRQEYLNKPSHPIFANSETNNNNNTPPLSRNEINELDEFIRQHDEQMRQHEQHRLAKEAYDKKSCIWKVCTRIKRFLTGKPKLRKGGNRTRKSQRRRKY